MRIGSLLNDVPQDHSSLFANPPSCSALVSSRLPQAPFANTNNNNNIDPSNNTAYPRSLPASPGENVLSYSPYQQSTNSFRECTVSSRSSYSGPSASTSTAATTPLESSTHHSNSSSNPASVDVQLYGEGARSSQLSGKDCLPPLPPFDSLISTISHTAQPLVSDPAISPRTNGFAHHNQRQQYGLEGGYFPPNLSGGVTTSYYQTRGVPQFHTQSSYGSQAQPYAAHNDNTSLMGFAEVAVEARRNLELEVAAAEALTGRRSSVIEGQENHRKGGSSAGNAIMPGEIREFAGIVVDPSLKPPKESEAISSHTGLTYSEATRSTEFISLQRSSIATQTTVNPPYDADVPLFRASPELSTPQQPIIDPDNAIGAVTVTPPSPHEFLSQPPKCSYCNVCTTGSPLRKVVSHIFGRNKLSTRQIPKNVWVYYCRKHYQRSRYRNPRGFARQQVLLVRRQCERLEVWGGVRDWVIKVRRREELRMNREVDNVEDAGEMDYGNEEAVGVDDELDENELGSGTSSRRSSTTTARRRSSTSGGSSNWIMRHTGVEKTITEIYKLLDEVEVEVQQNGGKFPDVELLPNVDLSLAATLENAQAPANGPGQFDPDGKSDPDTGHQEGKGPGASREKKRKHDDAAGGSSGKNSNAKATKKNRTTAKKASPKGKDKAQTAAECPRTPEPDTDREISPRVGETRDRTYGSISSTSTLSEGQTPQAQTMTPSPSGSPGYQSSQDELQSISPQRRRSSRVAPYSHLRSDTGSHYQSPPLEDALESHDLTPRQLAAIAGEPLHRFDLRRHREQGRRNGCETGLVNITM